MTKGHQTMLDKGLVQCQVWLTPEIRKRAKRGALEADMSLSAYLAHLIDGVAPREPKKNGKPQST